MQLQHFLLWYKTNKKRNCKSQFYRDKTIFFGRAKTRTKFFLTIYYTIKKSYNHKSRKIKFKIKLLYEK